jgi:DNA-directed RNA polymerase sigma subunit (sigma70/sigma32)
MSKQILEKQKKRQRREQERRKAKSAPLLVGMLTPREEIILQLRCGNNAVTLADTGKQLQMPITGRRVQQIESKILRKFAALYPFTVVVP